MFILSSNLETINETKKILAFNFDMKDMREADVISGIKITKINDGLRLSQEHYVEKIGYYDRKSVSIPYDTNTHLKKYLKHSVDQLRYAQIISSLMYLMNSTRLNIAYATGRLSRYTQNPSKNHWAAIDRLARYLRGTIDYRLNYNSALPVLEGYSDANWISGFNEIKSTSGYIFTLGGGAVYWISPK